MYAHKMNIKRISTYIIPIFVIITIFAYLLTFLTLHSVIVDILCFSLSVILLVANDMTNLRPVDLAIGRYGWTRLLIKYVLASSIAINFFFFSGYIIRGGPTKFLASYNSKTILYLFNTIALLSALFGLGGFEVGLGVVLLNLGTPLLIFSLIRTANGTTYIMAASVLVSFGAHLITDGLSKIHSEIVRCRETNRKADVT